MLKTSIAGFRAAPRVALMVAEESDRQTVAQAASLMTWASKMTP